MSLWIHDRWSTHRHNAYVYCSAPLRTVPWQPQGVHFCSSDGREEEARTEKTGGAITSTRAIRPLRSLSRGGVLRVSLSLSLQTLDWAASQSIDGQLRSQAYMMATPTYLSSGPFPFGLIEQYLHPLSLGGTVSLSSSSPSNTYDPFNSDIYQFVPYLSTFFILLSLVSKAAYPAHRWLPKPVLSFITSLSPFITEDDLKSQRGLDQGAFLRRGAVYARDDSAIEYSEEGFVRQTNKNAAISGLSLVEAIAWTFVTGWSLSSGSTLSTFDSEALRSFSTSFTWVTILLYFFIRKPQTPPIEVLFLVLIQATSAFVRLLSYIPYSQEGLVHGILWLQLVANAFDLAVCVSIIGIIFIMPTAPGGLEAQVPRSERKRLAGNQAVLETENLQLDYEMCPTTPEDYASLLSTLTYTWMESIQRLALKRPLVPSDIWRLRSINDTRTLSRKFAALTVSPGKHTLARRLLLCNANDIALDFIYKICGVTLAYAGPALMRAILECISDAAAMEEGALNWVLQKDGFAKQKLTFSSNMQAEEPTWTPRSKAFVLALVALIFTMVRYVAELKNFHHARQVGLRLRSVLVVELLEKALKRRDMKGIVKLEEMIKPALEEAQEAIDHAKDQIEDVVGQLETEPNHIDHQEGEEETSPLLNKAKEQKGHKKTKAKEGIESQADVGKVVNMMADDINTLLRLGCDAHQLYGAPIEVIIATTFLYQLMGYAALAGFALLVCALPLNYFVGQWYMTSATKWRKATDERISLVTELLMAIRFIKLQGVQERWRDKIMQARLREMWQMIYANMKEFVLIILWVAVPISCTIFTFFIYVTYQGQELTIPVAFTALTLFTMLRSPLDVIPSFAMSILRAIVSVRRLESYLGEEEIEDCISSIKKASGKHERRPDDTDKPLSIEAGSFTWDTQSQSESPITKTTFALRDITLSFPQVGLSVIEGPTASGKSSLLAALLGEMKRTAGQLSIPKFGKDGQCLFSFAGQVPWVEAGKSVKKNILFINDYDEERYRIVVHACALQDDFDEWEDGDETRVSKETLSGGQKARISLARAMYSHSKTVFLDDVLSAVDTRVQNHIYRHALTGPIAKDRRIVLVTHHAGLVLPSVKYLVRLKNGRVAASGTLDELRESGLLEEEHPSSSASSVHSSPSSDSTMLDRGGEDNRKGSTPDEAQPKTARLLYDLEARNVGNVKWSCYNLYLRASSPILWVLVIVASISLRFVASGEQYWLKLWGEASIRPSFRLPPAKGHQGFYLGIYGLIGLANVTTIIVRTAMYYTAAYRASKELYTMLLYSIVRAKMRFFDKNPTGRILQRFNSDFSLVDGQ
jgi:ABC-type multidrug transport system fused ATPase/permease subunit